MARVTLELPSLLESVLARRELEIEGQTLQDALEDAYAQLPGLRVHLVDESGRFRQHVLCFVNGTSTRWLDGADPQLRDGDRITILQAVSGG
ncbi:MAG TPA: MoaD/ThiS family protein [Vicinamibacterales bacterium]